MSRILETSTKPFSQIFLRYTCAPCIWLQKFSEILKNMTVIQFTALSVAKNYENRNDNGKECKDHSHSAVNIGNIVEMVKLKKFYIKPDDSGKISYAAIQYFVFLLLRLRPVNSSQLQALRIIKVIPHRGLKSLRVLVTRFWRSILSVIEGQHRAFPVLECASLQRSDL